MSMLKALSPDNFWKLYRRLVWTSTMSAWREHLMKIPMISTEHGKQYLMGFSIESTVKFTKSGVSVKVPLFFKLHIRWSGTFVNLKEQFDNMSYRLSLLRLQLSNLKPKVHDYLKFQFWPLACWIRPYGSFFDETNSKNKCCVRNRLVFNRNKTIFIYLPFTNTQKIV